MLERIKPRGGTLPLGEFRSRIRDDPREFYFARGKSSDVITRPLEAPINSAAQGPLFLSRARRDATRADLEVNLN